MSQNIDPIGSFLLAENIVSRRELKKAVEYQKKTKESGTSILLGEACIKLGFCSAADVNFAADCQSKRSLVIKSTTSQAMQSFRESVAKVRAATKEHLERVQSHS